MWHPAPRLNLDRYMRPDIDTLSALVREAAREELLPRFERVGHQIKADGSLLTEADLAMDRLLREALAERWPDVVFLSEEMPREEQEARLRAGEGGLWILDPLDGTSNFAAGIPLFSVSLALVEAGEPVLGIVYDPVRDECFAAERGRGATLNGARLRAPKAGVPLKRAVALVDFKRLSVPLATRLATAAPYASQRNVGTCALEWAWMAAGRGHVYLHGGMKLWDYAAGTVILEEAGGASATLQGESVFRPAVGARSVVASPDHALFAAWQQWLRD